MRSSVWLACAALILGGCSTRTASSVPRPGGPNPDIVVVGEDRRSSPRSLARVPPGHYPPPGQCRIWYAGRPPGRQPPPARCETLVGRVPYGAFLLHNGKAWDTEYEWRREETRRPGSVPAVVLQIMGSLVRN
jgi:hypothetical protein